MSSVKGKPDSDDPMIRHVICYDINDTTQAFHSAEHGEATHSKVPDPK